MNHFFLSLNYHERKGLGGSSVEFVNAVERKQPSV